MQPNTLSEDVVLRQALGARIDELYASRQSQELRNLKDALSILDLNVVAAEPTFRHAGHVARQMEYDPCRATSQ
eukprot:819102-Pyramimonas_sp.AAC.1